ncbi:hypothetical protein FA95DRAFT_326945 [Auriscalpium vulgare]|uniref:Uncharacterized protein n=1 Tax=Auriscalpium vulgare TaxID=40419 RepID=A0ACB8RIK5_9AGAM|nr:hypothetical protein FA95DRAFT_326945 [Auriscalpium vulgare]
MAGHSMPSHAVYHQSRVAHSIGLPNDDATLDQLVVHYEGRDMIDFPPRLDGSIITNDLRAKAFTRWFNDPDVRRVNIPAYQGQPQYYYFSEMDMTKALADPRSGLRPALQAFTQKIQAESAKGWQRPTVTSMGWNPGMGMADFGSTNERYEAPNQHLRGQARQVRNPFRGEPWFQTLLQEHQEAVSAEGQWKAGHPPGNCAEWNIPNELSMPETEVHLLTINAQTGIPKEMCNYCKKMVEEICRRKNIALYEYSDSKPVTVYRY